MKWRIECSSKLQTAVYPSNMARSGAKLWQNAFQTICNFSFFDPEKKCGGFFFKNCRGRMFSKKMRLWRSYEFQIRVGRCIVKSYCSKCPYFWGDFPGEGVNDSICVENLDLAPKMTSTIWCCEEMIWCPNDMMVRWYDDMMMIGGYNDRVIWWYDMMMWQYDDTGGGTVY